MFTLQKIILIYMILISTIYADIINFGLWSKERFKDILKNNDVSLISKQFINIPYKANTLIGDNKTKEKFVINFSGVDCFTYIDYVEAIRLSKTLKQFKIDLKKIRYKNADISYKNRNHFFSDWIIYNNFENISNKISNNKTLIAQKQLNKKNKNTIYLQDIPIVKRKIEYISSKNITPKLLNNLNTGDYIGVYTNINGLDVTHVGILIKEDNKIYFRHASSSKNNKKVVSESFMEYFKDKIGLIVFRAKIKSNIY
jgi:hypothetical protein